MPKQNLADIQKAFGEADKLFLSQDPLHKVATSVLEICGKVLNCQWGTFWFVDPTSRLLKPISTWSAIGIIKLEEDTKGKALSLSEGNAGHVWRSRKPIWTVNLAKDMCIPRSIDAEQAGLHGGIWFALKSENAVFGVIELLGSSIPDADEELLVGIELLGIRFGRLIEQKLYPAL